MEKVTIAVSDLHLGKSDELEDFVQANEDEFVRFLEKQSGDHKNKLIDLVILGDFIDIWQNATEREKHAKRSKEISIDVDSTLEISRTREIVAKHPRTFEALRNFLESNPERSRIFITPGNHDHSLILEEVQEIIKTAIAGGDDSLKKMLDFKPYYDEPELGIYAEHGNQFDGNNCYDNFDDFGSETAGYFFVRLFWNRLEFLRPNLDNWMNSFSAIFGEELWDLFYPAYDLFLQYYFDPRDFKRIKFLSVPSVRFDGGSLGVPERNPSLRDFPEVLFTTVDVPGRIFSTDNRLEQKMMDIYHKPENGVFREAVDKILKKKFQGNPPLVPQSTPAMRQLQFTEMDPCVSAVRSMFGARNGIAEFRPRKGGVLDPNIYKYVLMGHTHKEKDKELDELKVRYFNTGSWSLRRNAKGKNASRLSYVLIQRSSSGEIDADLLYWT